MKKQHIYQDAIGESKLKGEYQNVICLCLGALHDDVFQKPKEKFYIISDLHRSYILYASETLDTQNYQSAEFLLACLDEVKKYTTPCQNLISALETMMAQK